MVSTSGGIGRNKLPVPLAAFDKFVRTATKVSEYLTAATMADDRWPISTLD